MIRLPWPLRGLKFLDTSEGAAPASTGSRLLWLVLIWCVSVGALALVGLLLRLILKP